MSNIAGQRPFVNINIWLLFLFQYFLLLSFICKNLFKIFLFGKKFAKVNNVIQSMFYICCST